MRRLDATVGAGNWAEALDSLVQIGEAAPIAEIQFWGHGKWGRAMLGGNSLDQSALTPGHTLYERLCRIRERLMPEGEALWWFRTCETFGADVGLAFASAWTEFFGCRAAGHTYIVGFYQSGLHHLCAGERPDWSAEEGILEGSPSKPERARWSKRGEPNTITCMRGTIPLRCYV